MKLLPKTLTIQLALLILGLQASIAGLLGFFSYRVIERASERAVLEGLEALAATKQIAIAELLEDYRQVVAASYLSGPCVAEVVEFADDPTPERRAAVRAMLFKHAATMTHFAGAALVDTQGRALVSTSSVDREFGVERPDRQGVDVIDTVADGGEVFVRVSALVRREDGTPAARLVVRLRAREILDLTADYSGLGGTGETVLGQRDGAFVKFLVPLRFAPDVTNLPRPRIDSGLAKPMVHATSGQSGQITESDYRQELVVAVYRPLPGTDWGLVVKQDHAEIQGRARDTGAIIALGALLLMSASVLVVFPVTRHFLNPVSRMAEATDAVADGRLDVMVPDLGDNELGRLGRSFNHMVERLAAAHDEIEAKTADLERRTEEVEAFTYLVSHDLRTPLVSIRGMVDLLRREALSDRARAYLGHVDTAALRMGQLVNDLLELSRVGRVDVQPAWVESSARVRALAGELLVSTEGIEITVADDLPRVYCNGKRFYQVMSNLIGNAVKFTRGRPGARVEVRGRLSPKAGGGSEAVFEVRDNGPGIPTMDQEKIFRLFRRLHGPEVPGIGFGLAFVERILGSIGGWIHLESVPGEGTIFTFGVPASAPAQEGGDSWKGREMISEPENGATATPMRPSAFRAPTDVVH